RHWRKWSPRLQRPARRFRNRAALPRRRPRRGLPAPATGRRLVPGPPSRAPAGDLDGHPPDPQVTPDRALRSRCPQGCSSRRRRRWTGDARVPRQHPAAAPAHHPAPRYGLGRQAQGMMETAGLFDLQVNGFAGVDFNDAAITAERLDLALEAMRTTGVTGLLPTLITGFEDDLRQRLLALDAAVSAS